jgi:putative hydrolase of HD superfamily
VSNLFDEMLALKKIPRAGWLRVGIDDPESVAAHSWGVCWLVLALCPEDIDQGHALRLAVIHDAPEVRVGDITPYDGVSRKEKAIRETAAASDMFRSRPDLIALLDEYQAQETPEARFVHQLDRLDMAFQALRYGRDTGVDTTEFLQSARRAIQPPALLKALDDAEQSLQP